MKVITLYQYERPDGGITVSPTLPDCEYIEIYRLIADSGKILTDGNITAECIDTNNVTLWFESEDLSEEEILDSEAIRIILGE